MAAARRKSENMSKVDAAWYHMDQPTNMMMITSISMFDQPLDFQRVKATYEHRFLGRYPRFSMRVREGSLISGPRWEEDPHFDIAAHVHRIALPPPGDQAALQELVGDMMSTPLDYNKPPWQVFLVDGYEGGSAVITKLSHCIADGIALMHVLLDMADAEANAPWPEAEEEFEYRPPLWTRVIVPAMSAVDSTLRLGETAIHESMETVAHPERLLELAKTGANAALFGANYTYSLGKLLLLPADPKTIFKGKLGTIKRAAWTQPLELTDVKAVGKLLCGTVNDVLLAAVAGGLRRYMQNRGEDTTGLNLRAMVPVNLRGNEEFGKLGNRFGLIYLALPVGVEDTQERLRIVKKRMDAIKNSPEALVAFDILQAMGLTPSQMEKIFTTIFAIKATGVMTNVPGPRQPIYMFGQQLSRLMFWVPTSSNLSLGVSIFSYKGEVIIGISTDAGLAPDPENIVAGIEAEFRDMQEYIRFVREDEDLEDNGLPMERPGPAVMRQAEEAAIPASAAADAAEPSAEEPCEPCPPPGDIGISTTEPIGIHTEEPVVAEISRQTIGRNGDGELQGIAPGPMHPQPASGGMCQALTKAGMPCRNRALPGQSTCRVHAGVKVG